MGGVNAGLGITAVELLPDRPNAPGVLWRGDENDFGFALAPQFLPRFLQLLLSVYDLAGNDVDRGFRNTVVNQDLPVVFFFAYEVDV